MELGAYVLTRMAVKEGAKATAEASMELKSNPLRNSMVWLSLCVVVVWCAWVSGWGMWAACGTARARYN